jgi:hypothetical protein
MRLPQMGEHGALQKDANSCIMLSVREQEAFVWTIYNC